MNTIIYINGKRHNATDLGPSFYVDDPSLPGSRCAHHSLRADSVAHLRAGGSVHTSGNVYSLSPSPPPRIHQPPTYPSAWRYFSNVLKRLL